jgi:InsA N-terminal domain
MTFIAVRCPHCQSDQIVKRGKTARGTQRYLGQNTLCPKGSFLLDRIGIPILRLALTSP